MGKKRVSLKMLAAHLNISEGTASRALNNYPDISKSTRIRVQKAAHELGYQANPLARRLATGVAESIAYVMPETSSSISEFFLSQLLAGLSDTASRRGWDLIVSQTKSIEDEPSQIHRLINSGTVSGIVLSRPHKSDARIKVLQDANFPFVVHGRSVEHDNYAWYDVDSYQAFIDAVDFLSSLGHQRIGFIGAPTYYNFAQMRLDAYRFAVQTEGIDQDESLIQIAEMTDDAAERAAGDLLDASHPPTAILCATDIQAIGALAAIRARHLIPGHDISIIGYDGLHIGKHTNPPLTTFSQPQTYSGRRLGEMLMAIIEGGDPRELQELRSAELLLRKSHGPVRVKEVKTDTLNGSLITEDTK